MAYTLGNKCAKNLCKWTVLLQLIIENVVMFFWNTVYVYMLLLQRVSTCRIINFMHYLMLLLYTHLNILLKLPRDTIFVLFSRVHYLHFTFEQTPSHSNETNYVCLMASLNGDNTFKITPKSPIPTHPPFLGTRGYVYLLSGARDARNQDNFNNSHLPLIYSYRQHTPRLHISCIHPATLDLHSTQPLTSSTPPNTASQTPAHTFHPLADSITSHTSSPNISSHRFQPCTTPSTSISSSCPSLSLRHRRITQHATSTVPSSPTPSTSSVSSSHTYNTLLLQLIAIHSITSVTNTNTRFSPSIQAMLFTLSHSPFYPPNLPPPDQITVAEFSNAILVQLFKYFQTPPQ